ncbi:leucine-rich repeat domain-containing protein [Candidatus Saccharibacteria bacterium]|nr:leucine-rich repeat domain-containing protein [Candidatus Saccharibacteria bacterium]
MLNLHKKEKRIARLAGMAAIIAPFAGIGINNCISSLGEAHATSNTMSEGFVDQNFYDCVLAAYQSKHPDTEIPDTGLLPSQLSSLSQLSCNNGNITDISGAETLTGLWSLELVNNQISNLSPLSNLRSLQRLYLRANDIITLTPLASLTNLTSLGLSENNISDISALSGLVNLTSLNLSDNNISDISALRGLVNLSSLLLQYNAIFDISALGNMTNLKILDLSSNNISDISALVNIPNQNFVNINLDDNAIFDFSAIGYKQVNTRSSSKNQNKAIVTNQKTIDLPELFEQVKRGITSGLVFPDFYSLLYTEDDFAISNATLSADNKKITITDLSESARISVNGGYANGSTLAIRFLSNLVSIADLDAITDVANGTAKTATDLGLPETVAVLLENDIVASAQVAWSVDDSNYDPAKTEAQTFTVKGNVILPDYITNDNNLPLSVNISVSVLAATPEPSDDPVDEQPSDDRKDDEVTTPDTGTNTNNSQGSNATLPIVTTTIATALALFGFVYLIKAKIRK